ncbi:MAG: leucine-rich repeat domain-containing protein [Aggregatilineales bacterium]
MRKSIIILLILISVQHTGLTQSYQYSPEKAYEVALSRIEGARQNNAKVLLLAMLGLQEIPPEIGQLQNLEKLYLGENQLNSLPPEIGQLQTLQELYLTHNNLSNLPDEIKQLRNLKVLSIRYNNFRVLPPQIGFLDNLEGFYFDTYIIRDTLPDTIELYPNNTGEIRAYLRNQAVYHIRQMTLGAAGGVGILAIFGLLIRWRLRSRPKPKQKRTPA